MCDRRFDFAKHGLSRLFWVFVDGNKRASSKIIWRNQEGSCVAISDAMLCVKSATPLPCFQLYKYLWWIKIIKVCVEMKLLASLTWISTVTAFLGWKLNCGSHVILPLDVVRDKQSMLTGFELCTFLKSSPKKTFQHHWSAHRSRTAPNNCTWFHNDRTAFIVQIALLTKKLKIILSFSQFP